MKLAGNSNHLQYQQDRHNKCPESQLDLSKEITYNVNDVQANGLKSYVDHRQLME